MSESDQLSTSSGWSLARLFRGGRPGQDDGAAGAGGDGQSGYRTADRRRDLMTAICEFLIDNELEVDPRNLTAAYYALSGAHPRLGREVAKRLTTGYRVTQDWLDEISDLPNVEEEQEVSRQMMEELDAGLRQFARSTTEARSATREYNSSLEQHGTAISDMGGAADALARLVSLTQDMAARTRRIESELHEREQEAKMLRRRLNKVKRDAELDHLTGLPNRRAFEARFKSELEEAQAEGEELSIAICDIDLFKTINDTHGHETGDRVLQLIAKLLARISDEKCHIARHGGEEFVLLFRGSATDIAKARLDEARESLAARRLVNRDTSEPIGNVTFSAGVANVFAYQDPRQALRCADEALYKAKQAGRNAVLIAEG